MLSKFIALSILSVVTAATPALADKPDASETRSMNACFDQKLPYFQNFKKLTTELDRYDLEMTLENGCQELRDYPAMSDAKTTVGIIGTHLIANISAPLMGQALGAFALLKTTEKQRLYKAALEKIRTVQNPMMRIKLTYELAASVQGKYDEKWGGLPTFASGALIGAESPGNIINNAQWRGTVGVCREMANLLVWSLQQVSRYSKSTSMALGPDDFSAVYTGGAVPSYDPINWKDGGGHAWVRVNMPQFNSHGAIAGFSHFDLDTTWYPERFGPLFPRRSGISEEHKSALLLQCREVSHCLLND